MTITPEQRTYARLAGILFLAKFVLEGSGGESFAETARFAAENALLWRFALLNVGLARRSTRAPRARRWPPPSPKPPGHLPPRSGR
jgi:hypothetical protein